MHPTYTDEEKKKLHSMLRYVLESLVVLFSPLSTNSLSTLLHLKSLCNAWCSLKIN
jgi:hypothetical protein